MKVTKIDVAGNEIYTDRHIILSLQGNWAEEHIKIGDNINLIHSNNVSPLPDATENNPLKIIISQQSSDFAIVTNPDTLISITTVVNSVACQRRAVLAQRYSRAGEFSAAKAMLLGNVLHETFQSAVSNQNYSSEFLIEKGQENCNLSTLELLLNETDNTKLFKEVNGYVKPMSDWLKTYFREEPANFSETVKLKDDPRAKICIKKDIHDIEENFWNPNFGLKGKIDLTAEVNSTNKNLGLTPIELKSGKESNSIEHRSQVLLYNLLLSKRYNKDVDDGLLIYLKSGGIYPIPSKFSDQRELLRMRNKIADSVCNPFENNGSLPKPVQNEHACKFCPYQYPCYLEHIAIENNIYSENPAAQFLDTATGFREDEIAYFRRWHSALLYEQIETRKKQPRFWKNRQGQKPLGKLTKVVKHETYRKTYEIFLEIPKNVFLAFMCSFCYSVCFL